MAAIGSVSILDAARVLPFVTLAGLGALIASRQRKHPIGWILLGAIGSFAVDNLAQQAAIRSQLSGTSYSGWAIWLAWFQDWPWPLFFPAGLTVLFFLLLPGGKLLGRCWRWLLWADLFYTPAFMVLAALDPTPIRLAPHLPPVGQPDRTAVVGLLARQSWEPDLSPGGDSSPADSCCTGPTPDSVKR